MKIEKLVLCYPDMDRIILNKEEDLAKYDLSKISGIIVTSSLTLEEFHRFRAEMNQRIITDSAIKLGESA